MQARQWLECSNPNEMLDFLAGQASERKLRLLCAACSRRVWHLLQTEDLRKAIAVLEDYAEGVLDAEALSAALAQTHPVRAYPDQWMANEIREELWLAAYGVNLALGPSLDSRVGRIFEFFARASCTETRGESYETERTAQADILREIFHPWALSPFDSISRGWNDGVIEKLAEAIHAEQAFERLPILADAVEEAGCCDADLVGHLRGPGPHLRGCWALDLLLNRS